MILLQPGMVMPPRGVAAPQPPAAPHQHPIHQTARPQASQQQSRHHNQPKSTSTRLPASRRDALLTTAGLALLCSQPTPASAAAAAPAVPAPPKPFCGVVDRVPSWAFNTPWQEDLVDFGGGKTWYRYVNYVPPPGSGGLLAPLERRYSPAAPDKLPLLVVAGGPGFASSYLEPLELMAGVGRRVVFYDQVGCGNTFLASNSSCPPPDQLTPELYLRQLDALRAALKLERCHLYGQGVGGMLALSYAASRGGTTAGIASVTVGSVAASYQQLLADRRGAAGQLLGEQDAQALFEADNAAGSSSSAAAGVGVGAAPPPQQLWQRYEAAHVCRFAGATGAGGCVTRVRQRQSRPVAAALVGGRYFQAAGGGLADWSVTELDAAALQDTPVLVTRGEFDEVSQASAQQLVDALPSAQGRVRSFPGSGSYMHIDAWEPHLTRLEEHLCLAEGSTPPTAGGA